MGTIGKFVHSIRLELALGIGHTLAHRQNSSNILLLRHGVFQIQQCRLEIFGIPIRADNRFIHVCTVFQLDHDILAFRALVAHLAAVVGIDTGDGPQAVIEYLIVVVHGIGHLGIDLKGVFSKIRRLHRAVHIQNHSNSTVMIIIHMRNNVKVHSRSRRRSWRCRRLRQ